MASVVPYPPDHGMALTRVMRVMGLLTGRPDVSDDEVEAALIGEGVGPVDARLLTLLVPTALAYPMLRQLGVTGFPSVFGVRTRRGRWRFLPLAGEHYFTTALAWAEGLLALDAADRPLTAEAWNLVAGRSAEMDCVNNMLREHGAEGMRGAVMSPPILCGLTAEEIAASRRPSVRPWWRFW